jgi:hypothetical protein
MRFSLTDLFMVIACFTLGSIAVNGAGHRLGYGPLSPGRQCLFGVPLGVVFFVILTPPIYRHFRLLPLLLPVCPHCKQLPDGYCVLEYEWPRALVACGHCDRTTELWWSPPEPSDVSKTMPSLLLSWPHSIGRWRRISREGSV